VRTVAVLLHRELTSWLATPAAWIFVTIFLLLTGIQTFWVAELLPRGRADLELFFVHHPWLHLLLCAALSMRLWAEERRAGTAELLLTLPVRLREVVLAKFLGAWLLTGLALLLTCPVWLVVAWLGAPDAGVIVAGYLGSWLVAGAFLAIGSFASALAGSQVAAFILALALGTAHLVVGLPDLLELVGEGAPDAVVEGLAALSPLQHYMRITRGLVDLRDLGYFVVLTGAWLLLTMIVLDLRRAG
jgi:ABC-2 type transport system permease protein